MKEIEFAQIEDFFNTMPDDLSDKTRWNHLMCLKQFFKWFYRREKKTSHFTIPDFPEISYELEMRATVNLDDQTMILEEIKRLTSDNEKIYIAILWLSHYPSIRPSEMVRVKEEDIDTARNFVLIRHPKEKKAKIVPLLDEDVDYVRKNRGNPGQYFFRHDDAMINNPRSDKQIQTHTLWRWWKTACRNVNIDGVDLYGGTKHSTCMAMKDQFSPEEIRRATMHQTNKAFERYLQVSEKEVKKVYAFRSTIFPQENKGQK